ncbi:hypothetical protein K1X76_12700, partial [bacterium]|nr:hypothetical protein [bacterium]
MGELTVTGFDVPGSNCAIGIIGDDTNYDQSFQIGMLCQDQVALDKSTQTTTTTTTTTTTAYGFQVGGMTPPMLPTGYTGNNFYGASAGLTNYNRSQTGVSLA